MSGLRSGVGRRVRRTNRRGATLALVAVLFVGFVGMAALVVDIGRMRLGAAELQTSADAAALAAARAMQLNAAHASSLAPSAAAAAGGRNRSFSAVTAVAGGDVRPVRYDPATDAAVTATWATANGVEVTARARGTYALAPVLGASLSPVVARRGTAWIANVTGASCLTPWIVPYGALYALATGTASRVGAPALTQAQLGAMQTRSTAQRTVLLLPHGATSNAASSGTWCGADFNSADRIADYGRWLRGDCAGASANATQGSVGVQSSTSDAVVTATALNVPCTFRGASAVCYASATATTAGVTLRTVWGDATAGVGGGSGCSGNGYGNGGCNGNGYGTGNDNGNGGGAPASATVRMIGQLRVMCYVRRTTDICASQSGWANPFPRTGNTPGTVLAIVDGVGSMDLTPDVVLGKDVGRVQRLVLVR